MLEDLPLHLYLLFLPHVEIQNLVRLFRSKFNFAFSEKESKGTGVLNTEGEKANTTTSLRIKALKQGFWFLPKRKPLFQEVREQCDVLSS